MNDALPVDFQKDTFGIFEKMFDSLVKLEEDPSDTVLLHGQYLQWHKMKSLASLYSVSEFIKIAHQIELHFYNASIGKNVISKDNILRFRKTVKAFKEKIQADVYCINNHVDGLGEDSLDRVILGEHVCVKEGKGVNKSKVLIVEDDPVNSALLEENVKYFVDDLEIVSVDNAEEGIFYFFTEEFSVIFLDIMMPNINGNDFIAIAEKNYCLNNLQSPCNIVVQTAVQSITELSAIAQKECVQEVVRKPIDINRIKECVERYCM